MGCKVRRRLVDPHTINQYVVSNTLNIPTNGHVNLGMEEEKQCEINMLVKIIT